MDDKYHIGREALRIGFYVINKRRTRPKDPDPYLSWFAQKKGRRFQVILFENSSANSTRFFLSIQRLLTSQIYN